MITADMHINLTHGGIDCVINGNHDSPPIIRVGFTDTEGDTTIYLYLRYVDAAGLQATLAEGLAKAAAVSGPTTGEEVKHE